jgi:hypothetical protein
VCAIRDSVDNALITSKVKDCGLGTAAPAHPAPLIWTFPANASCPGGLFFLKIERGVLISATLPAPFTPAYTIDATRITLDYPYQWSFNRVIKLLVSGATYPGTTQLTSVSVMQNLN